MSARLILTLVASLLFGNSAFAAATCISTVTCGLGITATCSTLGTADKSICSLEAKYKACLSVFTSGNKTTDFVCCGSNGEAIAVSSASDAAKLCANYGI